MRLLKILLVCIFCIYFVQLSPVWAEEKLNPNLQFNIDGGKIYFFDPDSGQIYVYQITTNRFSHLLTLEKLGEDLRKSRSLSTIEGEANK